MASNITRRKFVTGTIKLAVVSPLVATHPITAHAPVLAAGSRRTLRAAVDVIIPSDGRMPAASAIGAVRYIERVTGADDTLRPLVVDGLRALDAYADSAGQPPAKVDDASRTGRPRTFALLSIDEQTAALAHLERTPSTQLSFAALRDLAYEAYYTHPRIWKLLGYTFRSGRQPTARLQPFEEGRLARVRALPPLYRQVP